RDARRLAAGLERVAVDGRRARDAGLGPSRGAHRAPLSGSRALAGAPVALVAVAVVALLARIEDAVAAHLELAARRAAVPARLVQVVALLAAFGLDGAVPAHAGSRRHEGAPGGARIPLCPVQVAVVAVLVAVLDAVAARLDLTGRTAKVARRGVAVFAVLVALDYAVTTDIVEPRAIAVATVAVDVVAVVAGFPGVDFAVSAALARLAVRGACATLGAGAGAVTGLALIDLAVAAIEWRRRRRGASAPGQVGIHRVP